MPDHPSNVEVVVAFIEDGGHYPRADKALGSAAYWRAITVMAATLRRFEPTWPVVVATNRPPIGHPEHDGLLALDVEFREVPFEHRPPADYFDRFSGSFYLLDALADAVRRARPQDVVVVVDPDCVWLRTPRPLVQRVLDDPDAILAYEITHSPGQPALGLTREQMATLFAEVSGRPHDAPAYAGGELLVGRASRLAQLLPHIEDIWTASLRRHRDGNPLRANTEEHVLSYALAQLGWSRGTANDFIRRIWTGSPPNRNIRGDEHDLTVWHALMEKRRGLLELYDDVMQGHPALRGTDEDFRRHLARRLRVELTVLGRVKKPISTLRYRLLGGGRVWPPED